jgi:Flp pilus assembly protein TadG
MKHCMQDRCAGTRDLSAVKEKVMKMMREESGQTTVLLALCMTSLLGVMALSVDVGTFLHAKRMVQAAADSAAIAGAAEIHYESIDKTTVTAAAKAAAKANGFTDGSNNVTVTVNSIDTGSGPVNGPHAGNTNYVEVVISQSRPTFFMSLFGQTSMGVAARAVAGLDGLGTNNGCMFVMNPTAAPAFEVKGSATVLATACGVYINSSNGDALDFTGAAGTLTAKAIGIVGGYEGGGATPTPTTGVTPVTNPFGYLPSIDPSTLTCTAVPAGKKGPGTLTLTGPIGPGCWSGGNIVLSNATLSTGTYVFTGGDVTLDGTVNSGTGGVTIDLDTGNLSENTGTVVNLSAPTTGTYANILFMAPSTNTNTITFDQGSASGTLSGDVYAPDMELFLHDSGGDHSGGLVINSDIVVGTVYDNTATLTINSYSAINPGFGPLVVPTLVE